MSLNPLLKKLVSQSASKYKSGNSNVAKLKEGRNVIRIIAPEPGQVDWVGADGIFFREIGVHWIKPDMNAKPVAVCGSEEICFNRISPLATMIELAIAQAYDDDSKELYKSWKARKSILVNVINRDANDGVEILELSPSTFGKIMDLVNLYDDSGVNVLDSATGLDLVITRTGKGLNTTYDVAAVPLAPGKMCKPVTNDQIKAAQNLDEFIQHNYFRGDEKKAMNMIAQVAGVAVPQIGAATSAQALTSSAATVDANVMAAAAQPAIVEAQPVIAAAQQAVDMQKEIERQAQILAAKMAAAQQQTVAASQTAQTIETVTSTTPMSDLAQDEQDRLLAELNAIG